MHLVGFFNVRIVLCRTDPRISTSPKCNSFDEISFITRADITHRLHFNSFPTTYVSTPVNFCKVFIELIHSIILILLTIITILNNPKRATLVLPFPLIIHVVYILFRNILYCSFVLKQYLNASDRTIPTYTSGLFPVPFQLTLRSLTLYIYMERLFLMFLDHTQRRSTVGRTPLDE